jgi:predicted GNAT family acetyltransferase
MKIQNKQSGKQGSFFIDEDGNMLAEMTYSLPANDVMIIDHTEVDESLRGKNVGSELVSEAVQFARAKNMKIVPQCSFARSVFQKTEDFRDVLE